jgi:superfamily I DNA/RNA helicase
MLTLEQEMAVTTDAQYSVVMAGAGSGKTTLLTERVLHLLEHGVEPHQVMPVTFTRKAARELRERIGQYASGMPIGTFHALCLNAMSSAGIQRNVIDEEQANDLLDKCAIFNGLAIPTSGGIEYRKQTRSHWKKHLKHHREKGENSPLTDTYLSKLAIGGDCDYDEILHQGLSLAKGGGSFFDEVRYVILDEAQDTTLQQWDIVHEIGKHASVMAVGDVAQNLFSWAGAAPDHFANLPWQRFELTETFRLTRNVTNLCNSFPMKHVQLRTSKGAGTTKVFMNDDVEGVVGWMIDSGMEDKDVAVLCRYNWQVEEYANRLVNRGFRVSQPQEQPRGPAYRMLMYMANMTSATARDSMRKAWAHLDAPIPALWMLADTSSGTAAALVNNWLAGLATPSVESILRAAPGVPDSAYYIQHFGGCSLQQFAAEASLLEPIATSAIPGITVDTIHSTKGGEWMGVVVPGLDAWPRGTPKEDEWRVFYVATSRSSDTLCLMCPGEPGAFISHCLSTEHCYV